MDSRFRGSDILTQCHAFCNSKETREPNSLPFLYHYGSDANYSGVDMSQGLAQITGLVARFEQNTDLYKAQPYNETQVRREFIDPFFEALGWDVANKSGYAEAYKDVIHEDAIKVGGATKAPDYCFRIGGVRKFFLEAKKPSTANGTVSAKPPAPLHSKLRIFFS